MRDEIDKLDINEKMSSAVLKFVKGIILSTGIAKKKIFDSLFRPEVEESFYKHKLVVSIKR